MPRPGFDHCIACNTSLRNAEHFCPSCERPTSHVTPEERAEWELRQWNRAHGTIDARPQPEQPPVEVPVTNLRESIDRARSWLRGPATPPAEREVAVRRELRAVPGVTTAAAEPEPEPEPALAPDPIEVIEPAEELIRPSAWGDDELAFASTILRPMGTMVDVGAGSGRFVQVARQAVGPDGRVVAIEPSRGRGEMIKRSAGDDRSVRVIHAYAWDDSPSPDGEHHRTLSSILLDLRVNAVDLLRIDARGSLPKVLGGAKSLLDSRSFAGPVMLHIDSEALAAAGYAMRDVLAFFPSHEWADTTGLRLGTFDPDAAVHTRVFERR